MQRSRITLLILYLAIGCIYPAWSQQTSTYRPLPVEESAEKSWAAAAASQHKQDLDKLPSRNRKYYETIYKERYESIKTLFTDHAVVSDKEASQYLQSLAAEIIQKNPALSHLNPRIFFSKTYWPNASSQGEGTILFNIGLFNRLQNESQAAFILCHELAHLYLDHSNKNIDRYVSTVYSDEFQKELKKINNAEYQGQKQLTELTRGLAFLNRRHSRGHETSADSLALEWMKNTAFRIEESLTCLALLDSVDEDKYNVSPPLEKVFAFKDYPFRAQWVQEEKSLFSTMAATDAEQNKKEKDSLKTHPDCSTRVLVLSPRVEQYRKTNSIASPMNEALFRRLQQTFDYEIIEYCYRSDKVSRSLYYSLQMLERFPGDPYLVANTGKCLTRLYLEQKNHTLSKVVDLPSPYNDKKYDKLLHFIQRVRLTDLAAFSYYYLLPVQSQYATSEEFVAALIRSKEYFNKPDEKQTWINHYQKQFPTGKYKF